MKLSRKIGLDWTSFTYKPIAGKTQSVVRRFKNLLGHFRASERRKGYLFITTSNFSKDAVEFAGMIDTKIVLIDGDQLSQFMIDNNVGVTPVQSYEVKRIDTDYFTD